MTECVICGNEVGNFEIRNGEMMCETCYNDKENRIFSNAKDDENA